MIEQSTISQLRPEKRSCARERRGCWIWAGWEPDRYYTRLGGNTTFYFGNGDWVPTWRNRIESDETLRRLADLGASVLITQFFKGMGPEVERATWPRLRDLVERANRYGLEVLGYVQGHSIFGEFVFPSRPEARQWVAQNYQGGAHTWGAAYHRFAPCFGHPGYQDYLKEILEAGLMEVGLGGFQLDNSYAKQCYCPGCRTRFRDWLDARGDLELRTGIFTAAAIEPPPLAPGMATTRDPLVRLWIEFGVSQRVGFLADLKAHVESISPSAIMSANPAYMKSYASRLTHVFDPSREAVTGDYLAIENGNQPRFEHGELFTQADKLLLAEAAGCPTMITSWRPGAQASSPPGGDRGVWSLMAEEYSFSRCLPGNNWMLRSAGDADTLLEDTMPVEMEAFRTALRFFEKLECAGDLGGRRQWGEICLYFDPVSLSLSPRQQAMAMQALVGYLIHERIAIRIVYPGQEFPPEARIVLLCEQAELSDAEMQRLQQLTLERGARIWLLGAAAQRDEWGVARGSSRTQAFLGHPGMEIIPARPLEWADVQGDAERYFQGAPLRWKKNAEPDLAILARRLRGEQLITVEADPGLLMNVEALPDGHLLVHLRDLATERREIRDVKIHFRTGSQPSELLGFSPSWWEQKWSVSPEKNVTLPPFSHYARLVIPPANS